MGNRKSKKLLVLLGVLLIVSAVTFGVSRYEKHVEKIKNTDETILSIDSGSVTALSWKNGDEPLSFHKEGENWIYDEDEVFPVDADKIENLLSVFEALSASYVIEDVENYGEYGLDDPVCTIEITTKEETYTVFLGGFSTMDEQRYVSIEDGKAYLVPTDPYESYDIALSDLILNDAVPDVTEATQIRISGVDDYVIDYEEDSGRSYNAEDVYFAGDKPLDTYQVSSYLQTVSYIALTDYVEYSAAEEDLAQYGLDEPELTLTITYPAEEGDVSGNVSSSETAEVNDDGKDPGSEVFTLSVSRNRDEVDKARESKEEDAESAVAAYARVGDSPIIYKITSQEYEELIAADYNEMRHTKVITADLDDINRIDIDLEGETYSLTSKGSGDDRKWYLGEEKIEDILELRSAIDALTAQDTNSFCDEMPDDSMKEEIRMTVYLDNENYPQIETVFYRYDGSRCCAEVDGEPFAYISREKVVDLMEAVRGIVLK